MPQDPVLYAEIPEGISGYMLFIFKETFYIISLSRAYKTFPYAYKKYFDFGSLDYVFFFLFYSVKKL